MKYLLLGILFLFATPAYASTPTVCTMEYAPVCGYHIRSDNQCVGDECKVYKTYSNQCMMTAEGAKFAHTGECTAKELGTTPEKDDDSGEAYVPPAGCIAWYDGCNSCSRGADGSAACTLRACLRAEPGYCIKWSETPMPVEPNGGIGDTPNQPVEPPVAVDGEAGVEGNVNGNEVSFFTRIWLSILSWF